jgi:DNA modification methylase
MTTVNLMQGDCLERLKELPDNSVDSVVTDPPYGLSFMGKKWDYDVPSTEIWEECYRVLKPGGHLLAFAGTRTQHRMAVRIEDAGFEIRDMIAWVYGSGFPKSLNISKAIDKAAGAEREVIGKNPNYHSEGKRGATGENHYGKNDGSFSNPNAASLITAPATDDAKKWDGWGTALKPALEPITVARKPLEEKTVVANVLKYGTGAINIDASRIPTNPDVDDSRLGGNGSWHSGKTVNTYGNFSGTTSTSSEQGRFPANLIHDGSEEVTELFPVVKSRSNKGTSIGIKIDTNAYGDYGPHDSGSVMNKDPIGTVGSAARFFYVPKTSKKDRNESVENNNHPTVKPTDLMRYLVTMVTPKGGTTLDPFMGSGSTGKGAKLGGFNFIGIELDPDYFEIAKARIDAINPEATLEDFF